MPPITVPRAGTSVRAPPATVSATSTRKMGLTGERRRETRDVTHPVSPITGGRLEGVVTAHCYGQRSDAHRT
ncbi:hypothetical protein GCM10023199_40760 [Actinomycetospora chibensis]